MWSALSLCFGFAFPWRIIIDYSFFDFWSFVIFFGEMSILYLYLFAYFFTDSFNKIISLWLSYRSFQYILNTSPLSDIFYLLSLARVLDRKICEQRITVDTQPVIMKPLKHYQKRFWWVQMTAAFLWLFLKILFY